MSMKHELMAACAALSFVVSSSAFAGENNDLEALRAEIQAMRMAYEIQINKLEDRIEELEGARDVTPTSVRSSKSSAQSSNSFNPALSAVLSGSYSAYSEDESELAGFAIGEEGERGAENFSLGETEITLSANVDDKFYGSTTVALVEEGGETVVELEEAYIETLGLGYGLNLKAGRFFQTIGYMNEHHAHADDFVDRPLPYRAFLNKSYNDDGVELSWLLPTDFYAEIGGGVFSGRDFPSGSPNDSAIGALTGYGRIGGDFTDNLNWRLGASVLSTDTDGRDGNEDTVSFVGDSHLYIADLRANWAPTGNAVHQEISIQSEYFYRDEDGTYEDTDAGSGVVNYDDHQSGWYLQSLYKFAPQWKIGARYSTLYTSDVPTGLVGTALDAEGHDPETWSLVGEWRNGEFGRLRAQYNREELSSGVEDNQVKLQYIMSIGAHGAHKF